MRKFFLAAALAFAAIAGTGVNADAAFKVRISDGTTTKIVTDNGADDNVAIGGAISTAVSFGNFIVTVATSTSKPLPPNSPFVAFMDVKITAVYMGSLGGPSNVLTVDITDTDFSLSDLPGFGRMTSVASSNNTTGITQTFQSYVNYGAGGNQEFGGIDNLGGTERSTGLQGPLAELSNDTAKLDIEDLSNPFSVSSRTVLTFAQDGTSSINNSTTVVTPAPAALLMVLSGIPALGLCAFRRRQSAVKVA